MASSDDSYWRHEGAAAPMSAAKDEAGNGQSGLESEEEDTGEKPLVEDESDLAQEDELPIPRLGQPNGAEEEDSLALDLDGFRDDRGRVQGFESPDSGSIQAPGPGPGRPSSADGSLSIPDDTPSVQVRASSCVYSCPTLIASGLNSIIFTKKKRPSPQLWTQSNAVATTVRSSISSTRLAFSLQFLSSLFSSVSQRPLAPVLGGLYTSRYWRHRDTSGAMGGGAMDEAKKDDRASVL